MSDELILIKQIAEIVELNKETRSSWDDYFVAVAMLIASRSNCDHMRVRCILVSNGEHKNRIVAAGYNGFMAGVLHNSKICDNHEQTTIYAEQNVITDAACRGINISNATAYISHFLCLQYSKLLAASGIMEIKYHFDYNNDPLAVELLSE
jgi:dCMP deaminase